MTIFKTDNIEVIYLKNIFISINHDFDSVLITSRCNTVISLSFDRSGKTSDRERGQRNERSENSGHKEKSTKRWFSIFINSINYTTGEWIYLVPFRGASPKQRCRSFSISLLFLVLIRLYVHSKTISGSKIIF